MAIVSSVHGPLAQLLKGKAGKSEWEWVDAIGWAVKPRSDYDKSMRILRLSYLSDQGQRTQSVLQRRYPKTWRRMPVATQNIVAETAELDAQVYRVQPERAMMVSGAEHDKEGFAALLEAACTAAVLPEVDRVACIARVAFLHLRIDEPKGEDPRPAMSVLWPHQVQYVPDVDAPGDLWRARVVAIDITGPGTDFPSLPRVREIWTLDGDTRSTFRVDEHGQILSPSRTYDSATMPIVPCHTRPTTSVFPHPDTDLQLTQDQINVTLSDHHHRFGLQAHQQMVATGVQGKGQEHAMGPDVILTFPDQGASVSMLPAHDSVTAFDAISHTLVLHGRSRREPIEAWHTKGGNPESGESRKIKNEWSDQKRGEHVEMYRLFEMRWLRALLELTRIGGIYSPPSEYTFDVKFAPPKSYDSSTTRLDRALKLLGEKLITPARAAVMSEVYATIDEAKAAGLSDELDEREGPEAPAMQEPMVPEIPDVPPDTEYTEDAED
jgi:hypothetical protein